MPIQEWSSGIWLVQLCDDPNFAEELDTLHDRLRRTDDMPHVVVDLANVQHLNSSNLSQLLRLRKSAVDGEAELRIASPCDAVWAVFMATGLDKVFEFTTDTTTALAELQINDSQE